MIRAEESKTVRYWPGVIFGSFGSIAAAVGIAVSWDLPGSLVVLKFLLIPVFLVLGVRWAQARVVTDRHGVPVYNLDRERRLPWNEVVEFEFNRWGPFIATVRRTNGRRHRLDGLSSIGFPVGPTVATSEEKIAQLKR